MNNYDNHNRGSQDFEFESLKYTNNYRKALLKEFSPYLKGNVLEIGAGVGHFTKLLRSHPDIKRIVAVEPEEKYCRIFREKLPEIQLLRGTSSAVSAEFGWNCIVCINVLEHIEDDTGELKHFNKLLQKNSGVLCLFVPARRELYSLIDKDFGHYRRYTKTELSSRLTESNFEVIKLHYFNFVGYFGWLIIHRILKQRRFNPVSLRFFDTCILPVVHFLESNICRPPIGQSLLAVAMAK